MKTLLIGNTSYITREFINTAFPSSSVFIFGPTDLKTSKRSNITVFSTHIRENLIAEVFESYEFDQVIYFSNCLTYKNKDVGELEQLQAILSYINDNKDLKFIYLTGPETENHEQVISRMAQGLCLNWENNHSSISIKVVQSPYLYSATNPHDYLYKIFHAIEHEEELEFAEPKKQIANFINLEDVADLLYKILDSWEAGTELLAIENPFQVTYEEFVHSLNELSSNKEYRLTFKDISQEKIVYVQRFDRVIRHRYGWLIRHSIIDELAELYRLYLIRNRGRHYKNRLKEGVAKTRSHSRLRKIVEVILLFLLSEALHAFANGQLQFRLVDVRLLFVVLISTVYGASYGIFAAVMSATALALANISTGTDWQLLFYNTERWIPFVAYIFVATICGFIQTKNHDDNHSLQKENDVLKEQNIFLQQAYNNIIHDKQQLKRQIIGSRDGFSKLFAIFKALDKPTTDEVLLQTAATLKDKLETDKIGIYHFEDHRLLAKLAPALAEEGALLNSLQVDLMDFPKIAKIIKEKDVWANKELAADYPAYAVGIYVNKQLKYLIWVEDVPYSRMNLYHTNLLKMVGQLTESALAKAYYYQQYEQNQEQEIETLDNTIIDFETRRID